MLTGLSFLAFVS